MCLGMESVSLSDLQNNCDCGDEGLSVIAFWSPKKLSEKQPRCSGADVTEASRKCARLTTSYLFAEGTPCVLPAAYEEEAQEADEGREPNSCKPEHKR